jgi:hypothetical protein
MMPKPLLGHAAVWFGAVPVVLEGCLLDHGQELVVAHGMRGGFGFVGHGRLAHCGSSRGHFIGGGGVWVAEEVHGAMEGRALDADGKEWAAIERAVDDVLGDVVVWNGLPGELHVALVAFRL